MHPLLPLSSPDSCLVRFGIGAVAGAATWGGQDAVGNTATGRDGSSCGPGGNCHGNWG